MGRLIKRLYLKNMLSKANDEKKSKYGKGKRIQQVQVTRGGKTYTRRQMVGTNEEEKQEKQSKQQQGGKEKSSVDMSQFKNKDKYEKINFKLRQGGEASFYADKKTGDLYMVTNGRKVDLSEEKKKKILGKLTEGVKEKTKAEKKKQGKKKTSKKTSKKTVKKEFSGKYSPDMFSDITLDDVTVTHAVMGEDVEIIIEKDGRKYRAYFDNRERSEGYGEVYILTPDYFSEDGYKALDVPSSVTNYLAETFNEYNDDNPLWEYDSFDDAVDDGALDDLDVNVDNNVRDSQISDVEFPTKEEIEEEEALNKIDETISKIEEKTGGVSKQKLSFRPYRDLEDDMFNLAGDIDNGYDGDNPKIKKIANDILEMEHDSKANPDVYLNLLRELKSNFKGEPGEDFVAEEIDKGINEVKSVINNKKQEIAKKRSAPISEWGQKKVSNLIDNMLKELPSVFSKQSGASEARKLFKLQKQLNALPNSLATTKEMRQAEQILKVVKNLKT